MQSLRAKLLELLADVDPWWLIDMGAPRDEYAPEVADLLRLPRVTPESVLAVFWRCGSVAGAPPTKPVFGSHPGITRSDAERIVVGITRLRRESDGRGS